jgi:hypothetical protein
MTDNAMPLQFIYLTLPDSAEPVLNIRIAGTEEMHRFALTRRQLLRLNAEAADAAMRGEPQ